MDKLNCAACKSVRREPPVRGKVFYRCFNDGAGSRRGFVVDSPWPESANAVKIGIAPPVWCPLAPAKAPGAPGHG